MMREMGSRPLKSRLLEQGRALMRVIHRSIRTEAAYLGWMERFLRCHRERAGRWVHPEEKVSGLFSGELSSEKMPSWEDQNAQTKRVGWVTPYNRGKARSTRFHKPEDGDAFEQILAEGRERDACRMLA